MNSFYEKNNYEGIWSREESWKPLADSMFQFIKNSRYYGLYPEDYHYRELDSFRSKIQKDSLARMDAVVWTKADLLFTDAFMKTLKDLKEGRMLPDSVSIVSKMNYTDSFFIDKLKATSSSNNVSEMFESVEPTNINYVSLRNALPDFVDNMDTQKYLFVHFPYIDTLAFYKELHQRLLQSGIGGADAKNEMPDSIKLSKEIKKYQANIS